MNDSDIRKLAKLTVKEKGFNKEIMSYVVNNFKRSQLSLFLRLVKTYSAKNTVRVMSENPISEQMKKKIKSMFADYDVIFEQAQIGDGIKVAIFDTIVDLSLSGFVNETIEKLKN